MRSAAWMAGLVLLAGAAGGAGAGAGAEPSHFLLVGQDVVVVGRVVDRQPGQTEWHLAGVVLQPGATTVVLFTHTCAGDVHVGWWSCGIGVEVTSVPGVYPATYHFPYTSGSGTFAIA